MLVLAVRTRIRTHSSIRNTMLPAWWFTYLTPRTIVTKPQSKYRLTELVPGIYVKNTFGQDYLEFWVKMLKALICPTNWRSDTKEAKYLPFGVSQDTVFVPRLFYSVGRWDHPSHHALHFRQSRKTLKRADMLSRGNDNQAKDSCTLTPFLRTGNKYNCGKCNVRFQPYRQWLIRWRLGVKARREPKWTHRQSFQFSTAFQWLRSQSRMLYNRWRINKMKLTDY